ncbi:MAG: radical SAM protein [Promethearchaeota archaeon]|nr:MAG: radical SAM protein [Candidatus Lokiarchaeota archaeon]
MGTCKFCGKNNKYISETLEVCRECIINGDWNSIHEHVLNVHEEVRKMANLPGSPPKRESNVKVKCNYCINECSLSVNDVSYCGLRNIQKNDTGELPFPSKSKAYIHGYLDNNPTNCCNSWFCPAGTSNGYPQFSSHAGPEYGTYSYAAFLYGCTFDCLFCQNYSHKFFSKRNLEDAEEIADQIVKNEKITCLCYFGGTPESQLPFSIHLAELILDKIKKQDLNRIFRVCWEWNGSGNQHLIEKCMKIALKTGGNIKFDLKSYHEKLNMALCGISNSRTLQNFECLAKKYFGTRPGLPEMSACTLLVPGYLVQEEVEQIAKFISKIDNEIPYSLLVFHGDYQMKDLPITPRKQAESCLKVAKKYLKNVHLGNKFLLGFF